MNNYKELRKKLIDYINSSLIEAGSFVFEDITLEALLKYVEDENLYLIKDIKFKIDWSNTGFDYATITYNDSFLSYDVYRSKTNSDEWEKLA